MNVYLQPFTFSSGSHAYLHHVSPSSWIAENLRLIPDRASYFVLCVVSLVSLGVLLESSPHPVHSKLFIAAGGGLTSILAVFAGFATATILGFKLTGALVILPFLTIGLGEYQELWYHGFHSLVLIRGLMTFHILTTGMNFVFVILNHMTDEISHFRGLLAEARAASKVFVWKPHKILGRIVYKVL